LADPSATSELEIAEGWPSPRVSLVARRPALVVARWVGDARGATLEAVFGYKGDGIVLPQTGTAEQEGVLRY